MFPGLVLRITEPKVVYLCFRSGKIVITGARDRGMISSSFASVYEQILKPFIDSDTTASNSAQYRHECMHRMIHRYERDGL
jgi:hypothetical protein